MNIKFYIGPMTKNVIDSVIDFANEKNINIALIPSRRQIEYYGGYVNKWSTKDFTEYVKIKTDNVILQRDHSGPDQGIIKDDGYESLKEDCKYFDLIHIDPWKKYSDFNLGLKETIKMINFCYNINSKIKFEVGTEEAIRRFESDELANLMYHLKNELESKIYKQITYLVIQSGTSLKGTNQTGTYDVDRLKKMIDVCKQFNVSSKEHNGDYISLSVIKEKFSLGLDSINIAPEFGLIETDTYLEYIKNNDIFEKYWKICYDSNRWKKWVNDNFNPFENKKDLIKICGHYVLSDKVFVEEIKSNFPNIDEQIKLNIRKKLNSMYE